MFILPSRGRPHRLCEFIKGYEATDATAPVLVRVDEDDPCCKGYQGLRLPGTFRLEIGPRVKVSGVYADIWNRAPDLPWYGFLGDDLVPVTKGWDAALIEAAGSDGVSWPNDECQAPACTHPVIGGDLARCVGWLTPPGFLHWYADTTWAAIACATGRHAYLEHVIVRHNHPMRGAAPDDATYQERFVDVATGRDVGPGPDNRRWQEFQRDELPEIIERVMSELPRAQDAGEHGQNGAIGAAA